jgi:hypothetical protein
MLTPQFNSNYNSMQAMFQRRFSGPNQVNVAYTWAKNLTDNQTDRSTAPMNSYDIRADRGRATLDRRHILTTNYIYELPFFQTGMIYWQCSGRVAGFRHFHLPDRLAFHGVGREL